MRYIAFQVRGKGSGENREEVQILKCTPLFSFRLLLLTILNDAVGLCYFVIQPVRMPLEYKGSSEFNSHQLYTVRLLLIHYYFGL